MRTLWAADPVKYCRAAPQTSGRTVLRSTWRPSRVRIDALVSPRGGTSAPGGSSGRGRWGGALGHLGQLGEGAVDGGRVGRGGQQVDVVDGGLHAPQRPGDLDPLDLG